MRRRSRLLSSSDSSVSRSASHTTSADSRCTRREDGEAREERLLVIGEQVVGPRIVARSVACRSSASRVPRSRSSRCPRRSSRLRSEELGARRGELDASGSRSSRAQIAATASSARLPGRTPASARRRAQSPHPPRAAEGRLALALDAQRLAAGYEEAERWAAAATSARARGIGQKVLDVVEDDVGAAAPQRGCDRGRSARALLGPGRRRARPAPRPAPARAARTRCPLRLVGQQPGQLDPEPRLARPSRPRDGQHTRILVVDDRDRVIELSVPPRKRVAGVGDRRSPAYGGRELA